MLNKVVHLDAVTGIRQILDDGAKVQLTITSPPYLNAIDYDIHSKDNSNNYRTRGEIDTDQYWKKMESIFDHVLQVHQEGTFCAVVIGTVLDKGRYIPLPFQFCSMMEEIGWEFYQDIIWSKVTGGVPRAGSAIQHPFPGYFYPNLMNEYILIFKKPGDRKIYQDRSPEDKSKSKNEIDSVFTREIANNIWNIAPVPPGQINHPCPYPEEIPYRLIRWYSYVDDLVLDPFSGSGMTCKVANHLNRRWIAFETNEAYVELSNRRAQEELVLRTQLIPEYRKIPYGEKLESKNKKRSPRKTKR